MAKYRLPDGTEVSEQKYIEYLQADLATTKAQLASSPTTKICIFASEAVIDSVRVKVPSVMPMPDQVLYVDSKGKARKVGDLGDVVIGSIGPDGRVKSEWAAKNFGKGAGLDLSTFTQLASMFK